MAYNLENSMRETERDIYSYWPNPTAYTSIQFNILLIIVDVDLSELHVSPTHNHRHTDTDIET